MPSNICGAVIMWERDDVHSEWLWKAELGAMVRIYEDIPSSAQSRFFFFLWSCLEGDIEFPLLGGHKKFG